MFITSFEKRTEKGGTTGGLFIGIGILLIVFAVLIVIMPQLLAVLLAGFIMFVGLGLVSFGVQLKFLTKHQQTSIIARRFHED